VCFDVGAEHNIFAKLQVLDRSQAVAVARDAGLGTAES
jgi:hypothetical protein